jgi:hypothetical protein
MGKKSNVKIYVDAETRKDFDYLKTQHISVSTFIKAVLKQKVAEMKKMEEASK